MAKLNQKSFTKQMKAALDYFTTWDSIKQLIISKTILLIDVKKLEKIHPLILITGEDVSPNTTGAISNTIYVHLYSLDYIHYVIQFDREILSKVQTYNYDREFGWMEYIDNSVAADGFTETVLVLET